jgi:hypothetical protein
MIWEDKRAQSNFERQVEEISRRVVSGEHRIELMNQLDRLMVAREQREVGTRLLNVTDIYNNLQEFTEPILPAVSRQVEAMIEEQPQEANLSEMQAPIEPVSN